MAEKEHRLRATSPGPSSPLSTVDWSISSNGIDFRERHVAACAENPRHEHEYQCVGFVLEGLGTAEFSREDWRVHPGDLNVIPAGIAHRERFGTPRVGWCSMEFVNPPEELDRLARRAFARPVQISRGPACEIARRIVCEMRIRDDLSSLSLWGLGIELLTTIARYDDPPRQESNPVWLGRVVDLLRTRCCEAISVREVAHEAGVHPGHLARTFRRARGCTIGEFLRGERIERAKSLLVRSDESIALIAARVGFSDQAHLTRAFKRDTGTTPAAYRASARWR